GKGTGVADVDPSDTFAVTLAPAPSTPAGAGLPSSPAMSKVSVVLTPRCSVTSRTLGFHVSKTETRQRAPLPRRANARDQRPDQRGEVVTPDAGDASITTNRFPVAVMRSSTPAIVAVCPVVGLMRIGFPEGGVITTSDAGDPASA